MFFVHVLRMLYLRTDAAFSTVSADMAALDLANLWVSVLLTGRDIRKQSDGKAADEGRQDEPALA
ncbi:hypothetical protein D4A92_22900 (plasmid) [Rhizobium rosettiformans]|uniref:Uncharacterized protein n=1 Tax=Rhizobium rosettiformans TaxID=1368430 RepID=A0ABX7F237_9HYPH|nr:hypothetical protein D4A92_22900 [Rhizobium rosettiformans]